MTVNQDLIVNLIVRLNYEKDGNVRHSKATKKRLVRQDRLLVKGYGVQTVCDSVAADSMVGMPNGEVTSLFRVVSVYRENDVKAG